MEKLVKGVNNEVWKDLREESIKHNMRIGDFIEQLVHEHKELEKAGGGWDFILNKRASISEKQAKEIQKAISIFEDEKDFE